MLTTSPERQIEIERIAEMLAALPIGETLTKKAMAQALGGNPSPWSLIAARKRVEQETGLRFETVHKIGVKKLEAGAIIGIGAAARKRIRRMARAQSARLTGLRYNGIDATTQARLDVERSLLGAISATAAEPARKQVETHAPAGPQIPARIFEMLKGQK